MPSPTVARSSGPACATNPTRITYHEHLAAISGMEYGLPPDGRTNSARRLPLIANVLVAATRLGPASDLTAMVGRHWHVHVQKFGGSTSTYLDAGMVGLRNRSMRKNAFYVVFRATHIYRGTFSNVCAGAEVTGRYTTFGPVTTVLIDCSDPETGDVQRVGHQLCT